MAFPESLSKYLNFLSCFFNRRCPNKGLRVSTILDLYFCIPNFGIRLHLYVCFCFTCIIPVQFLINSWFEVIAFVFYITCALIIFLVLLSLTRWLCYKSNCMAKLSINSQFKYKHQYSFFCNVSL